jgi:16S rRNA (cytidine1402-2'-O)-methyltransferase
MGTLYLVATPIGNLEDITLRAIKVLKQVDLIAAEDTRTTKVLLNHYDIHTKLISNHKVNENRLTTRLLDDLANKDIAIVSDAGTPLINDPGFPIVTAAIQAGYRVVPIPGPSSPITALTASGLPSDEFMYLGYLPHKSSERLGLLKAKLDIRCTLILLETPHRLLSALHDIRLVMGNRKIAVCRELTKLFEEIIRGSVDEVISHFSEHPPIGEFTLVLEGNTESRTWSDDELLSAIQASLDAGEKPSALASRLAVESGRAKKEIYKQIQTFK